MEARFDKSPVSWVVQELIYVGPACSAATGLGGGDECSGSVAGGERVANSHVASQDREISINGAIADDSIGRSTWSRRRHCCGCGDVGKLTACQGKA